MIAAENQKLRPIGRAGRGAVGVRRHGTTMVECVISAMLLVTVMSFVTSLTFRVGLVWKDVGHQRAAMNELSNQLQRLTALSANEIAGELDSLQPSEVVSRTLNEAKLTGELVDDELGRRVVLQLQWQRRHRGTPVELVGWLLPPAVNPSDEEVSE